jgi:hypothetical protein
MTHPVTAVGRMLTPKHGEPQRCERIRIKRNDDGSVKTTEWHMLVEDSVYDVDGPLQLT